MAGNYDNRKFFAAYQSMAWSSGLQYAGEWHQLEPMIPDVRGKTVLDLGCGMGWPVDNYYYPGERKTDFLGFEIVKYHHTLSQILNPLISMGFTLQKVEEAMPPADMLDIPGMQDEMRRPMMLLVQAKKDDLQAV